MQSVCYLLLAHNIEIQMTRQLFIHAVLLFALAFQSLAQAVPCCVQMDTTQSDTTQSPDMIQHGEEGCFAGSPACCVVPSLAYEAAIQNCQTVSSVHVPTVRTLLLSQFQIPPERPPRA